MCDQTTSTFWPFMGGNEEKIKDNIKCTFGTFGAPFSWRIFDYKIGGALTCLAKMHCELLAIGDRMWTT